MEDLVGSSERRPPRRARDLLVLFDKSAGGGSRARAFDDGYVQGGQICGAAPRVYQRGVLW
jgi:hypothetical protein